MTSFGYHALTIMIPLVQYENFVTTWSMFDPEATGCIQWHVLPKLLQQLDEPLGFGPDNEASVKEMTTFIGRYC